MITFDSKNEQKHLIFIFLLPSPHMPPDQLIDTYHHSFSISAAVGAKGEKGDRGEKGERGPKGDSGVSGVLPAAGAKGEKVTGNSLSPLCYFHC